MNPAILSAIMASATAPTVPAIRIQETFDSGTAPGWTNSGCTLDYATAPAPLGGTGYAATATAGTATLSKSFSVIEGTLYGYGVFACPLLADQGVLQIYAGADRQFQLRVLTSGAFRVRQANGTTVAGSSAGELVTADTFVHYWYDYLKGTGADGVFHLYHSANATKPGSPTFTLTNLTGTGDPTEIKLSVFSNGGRSIWENVMISSEDIGSSPF